MDRLSSSRSSQNSMERVRRPKLDTDSHSTITTTSIFRPGIIPITTIGPGIIPKSTATSISTRVDRKSSQSTNNYNVTPGISRSPLLNPHSIPRTSGPGIISRALIDKGNTKYTMVPTMQRNLPMSGPGILKIPIENTRTTNVVTPRSSTSQTISRTKILLPNDDSIKSRNVSKRETKSNDSSRSSTPRLEETKSTQTVKGSSPKLKSETIDKSRRKIQKAHETSLKNNISSDPARKVTRVPPAPPPMLPPRIVSALVNSPRGYSVQQETPTSITVNQNILYQKFKELEKELYLTNTKLNFQEIGKDWRNIAYVINKLQASSLDILKCDVIFYTKSNIDQRVWKLTVYDYVILAREFIKTYPESVFNVSKFLDALTKLGVNHFDQLLSAIEEKHPITRIQSTGVGVFSGESEEEQEAAKLLYGRILISSGDTKRYNIDNKENQRHAMEEYEKSRSLDPTQGRAYHQMGIVALQRQDFIAAAYNFTRALCSSKPADGSRQQLLIVYDEAHKVYQKVSKSLWYAKAKTPEKKSSKIQEIWILKGKPIPPLREAPHTKETHFESLKPIDIYRKFAITYVQVLGKMFTGIGMDTFNIVAEESLVYFEGLMNIKNSEDNILLPLRIVQIMTLNMYMVDSLLPNDINEIGKRKLPDKLLLAVQYTLEMFSLLAERLLHLLNVCGWRDPLMETISVGLHVCVEWMMLQPKLWARRRPRPLFSIRKSFIMKTKNIDDKSDEIWIVVSELMTKLEVLMHRSEIFPLVSEEKSLNCKHSISPLPEVANLVGFPNFEKCKMLSKTFYTNKRKSKDKARTFVRLKAIYYFGTVLTTKPYEILKSGPGFSPNAPKQYTSDMRVIRTKNESNIPGLDRCHYHFWVQNYNPAHSSAYENVGSRNTRKLPPGPDCNNAHIVVRKPKKPKPNLPPPRPRMVNYEIWVSFGHAGFQRELIVQPLRIVLDTNCFIGHLKDIQILVTIVPYRLYIPVVVLIELKGLAKGGLKIKDREKYGALNTPEALEKYREGNEVARCSREAMDFLAKHMDYFIFITSTAKVLDIKSPYHHVKDDFFEVKRRNDDRILDACKYMESRDTVARRLDCPHRVYRNTVLATGDRILRLKTIGTDLPSRPIHSLLLWFACQQWNHLTQALRKKIKDDNRKAYLKRKERREQRQKRESQRASQVKNVQPYQYQYRSKLKY